MKGNGEFGVLVEVVDERFDLLGGVLIEIEV